jgi:hypothetical protein
VACEVSVGVVSGISMWQCALKASLPRLKIKMQRHGAAFFKDILVVTSEPQLLKTICNLLTKCELDIITKLCQKAKKFLAL